MYEELSFIIARQMKKRKLFTGWIPVWETGTCNKLKHLSRSHLSVPILGCIMDGRKTIHIFLSDKGHNSGALNVKGRKR